jgi:hypothetical protein
MPPRLDLLVRALSRVLLGSFSQQPWRWAPCLEGRRRPRGAGSRDPSLGSGSRRASTLARSRALAAQGRWLVRAVRRRRQLVRPGRARRAGFRAALGVRQLRRTQLLSAGRQALHRQLHWGGFFFNKSFTSAFKKVKSIQYWGSQFLRKSKATKATKRKPSI